MAKYNVDSLPQIISLGKQGENRARAITIDCGEMLERWSGAEIVLRAMRPGESVPYIVSTEIDSDGVMTWQPDSVDTAIAGTGRAELMCTVDGCVEKSAVFATSIKAALSDITGDKADAPSSWTQKVLDAVGTITETAEQVSDLISGVGAKAITLDAGADATVTSDGKTLTFGIPRGAQGLQGIQGERGEKGDKGDTGAKGDKGDTGEQGAQGIQGERGLQGVQGERGLQGEKGDKGDTGAQGIQGVQGEKGADGVSPKVTVTQSDDGTVISVTDADGTTSATVKGGGESVQADWAQNDSTAKDYIKNRVGGYGAERSYTWDGTVTDDMTTITYGGNTFYYAEGLATGDAFSKLTADDLPSEAIESDSGTEYTGDTTIAQDSETGYYTVSLYGNVLALVAWGVASVADGMYFRKIESNNEYITNLTLGSIAKIPTKYLPITDEITEGSTDAISSGAIYDMPKLEYAFLQHYKWDGNATDTSIEFNYQTFYKVNMYENKYDPIHSRKVTDLPSSTVTLKYQNGTFTGTAKYDDVTINGNDYWAMSAANSGYYQVLICKDNDDVYFAMCDMIGPGHYYLPELKIMRPIALPTGYIPTTDTATSGSATPITSGGVYTLLGDVETLLKGV